MVSNSAMQRNTLANNKIKHYGWSANFIKLIKLLQSCCKSLWVSRLPATPHCYFSCTVYQNVSYSVLWRVKQAPPCFDSSFQSYCLKENVQCAFCGESFNKTIGEQC